MSIAKVYTLTAHFDEGVYANTVGGPSSIYSHGLGALEGVDDQVQLAALAATRPFNFIHVPGSGTCTLVRINATSGAVVGEYRTRPDGNVAPGPSRIAIDRAGNVYVANRQSLGTGGPIPPGINGSIAKIGIVIGGTQCDADGTPNPTGLYRKNWDYTTCIDRDGDGLLKTSYGLGDVRAWTTDTGTGSTGSVLGAADD